MKKTLSAFDKAKAKRIRLMLLAKVAEYKDSTGATSLIYGGQNETRYLLPASEPTH